MSYLGSKTRNLDPVINYIENGRAYNSTQGWNPYDNGGSTFPTTGSGGSPFGNIAWSRSTTTPLRQGADFNFDSFSAFAGYGVSYDFTIDNADLAKVLTISFDYELLSGTYRTGDLTVYVIQNPSVTPVLIQPAGYQIQSATIGTKMKHVATFQTASNVNSYRLCLHIASTEEFPFALAIDNVVVGPQVVQYGAPVTDWQSYLPTFTGFGTVSAVSMFWRRVGDSIEIQGKFTSGTTTAVEARVSFPGVTSAGTDKIPNIRLVGQTQTNTTTGSGISIFNTLVEPNVTYLTFGYRDSANLPLTKQLGTLTGVNGQATSLYALVPIAGWSSTVQMSNDTDTRVVAARISKTAAQSIPNNSLTKVTFSSSVFYSHSAFDFTNNRYSIPVPGIYRVSSLLNWATVAAGGRSIRVYKNGSVDSELYNAAGSSVTGVRQNGTAVIQCNTGDYIEVFAFQDSGAAMNIDGAAGAAFNFLTVERLSGPSAIAASETVAIHCTNTAGTSLGAGTDTTIPFATKVFDTHGAFNTTTGVFTAPISGKYQINSALLTSTMTLGTGARFRAWAQNNTTSAMYDLGRSNGTGASNNYAANGSVVVDLLSGQQVIIRANSSVAVALNTADGNNQLSIVRVGN
jgi:hypothetical protein